MLTFIQRWRLHRLQEQCAALQAKIDHWKEDEWQVARWKARLAVLQVRKARLEDVSVQFADDFNSVAKNKLIFLQNQGGRVIELVLADKERGQARLDRFGKVTWQKGDQHGEA